MINYKNYLMFMCIITTLTGCALLQPNLTMNYKSDPNGATLYSENKNLGKTPQNLTYQLTEADVKAGYKIIPATYVRWLSGTISVLQDYRVDLSKGYYQEFTFIRPQDAPGKKQDVEYAVEIEKIKMNQEFALRKQEIKNNANLEKDKQRSHEQERKNGLMPEWHSEIKQFGSLWKQEPQQRISSKNHKSLNINLSKHQEIRGVEIKHGLLVDSIEFIIYDKSNGNITKSGLCGGSGGTYQQISFDNDEYLIGIFGGKGDFLDRIGFITNKRKYGPYGGQGGNAFEFIAKKGKHIKHINITAQDLRDNLVVGKISAS